MAYSVGDVNCDSEINISDVTLIQKYLASKVALTNEQILLADTDDDGTVDIFDVTHIQKRLANCPIMV